MSETVDQLTERAAAWAQAMAASPPIKDLVAVAAKNIDEGADEASIRERVRERVSEMEIDSWRFFLPGVNRKATRYPFPKMLVELAKYYAKGTRHKTVKDFIDSLTSRIGWDEWWSGPRDEYRPKC